MKQFFMPAAMWHIFRRSFRENLFILGVSDGNAIMVRAKQKYNEIVEQIPPFGKNDILLVNILSAATVY